MELRFCTPSLAQLDQVEGEVLLCSLWQDIRPSRGVAGLCDFRLSAQIGDLQRAGYLTGEVGEVMLLPAGPRLPFDKLLLFGAGERSLFNDSIYLRVVERMIETASSLLTRTHAVELPGRADELITAEHAADLLLRLAAARGERGTWTLVESTDGKQRIIKHMVEERRRLRQQPHV